VFLRLRRVLPALGEEVDSGSDPTTLKATEHQS
jgi:hypothetical protein